jgi:transposase-like protein
MTISPSRYTLKEGRDYGRINNNIRYIAVADIMRGMSVNYVANMYNVSANSIYNWIKTAYRNNPNLT